MKYKDKRLKIMNEILSGIKVKKKKKPNRKSSGYSKRSND